MTDLYSFRVHQAAGMISVQAQCSIDEAMHLLVIRAMAMDMSVEDMSLEVLDHRVRFQP